MTNDEFKELVEADIRGEASLEQQAFLRDPASINRWRDQLVLTCKRIDTSLTIHKAEAYKFRVRCLYGYVGKDGKEVPPEPNGKKNWMQFYARELSWRASTCRFKRSAEDRLIEIKQLMREQEVKVVHLRTAIERHKSELQPSGWYSDEDEDLWSTLGT